MRLAWNFILFLFFCWRPIVSSYTGAAISLLDFVYLPLHISGVSFRMIGYGLPRVCYLIHPMLINILLLFRLETKRSQIMLMLMGVSRTLITSQYRICFDDFDFDYSGALQKGLRPHHPRYAIISLGSSVVFWSLLVTRYVLGLPSSIWRSPYHGEQPMGFLSR